MAAVTTSNDKRHGPEFTGQKVWVMLCVIISVWNDLYRKEYEILFISHSPSWQEWEARTDGMTWFWQQKNCLVQISSLQVRPE